MKTTFIALCIVLALASIARAAQAPQAWAAKDIAGQDVSVPDPAKTTLVAFLRPGQAQSAEAIRTIVPALAQEPAIQLVIVLSGPENVQVAPEMARSHPTARVVTDPDYAIAGKMSVRVWPVTSIVATDGTELAHLSGMPASFAVDLQAHLDFATGKIDRTALGQRLTTRKVVAATSQQAATRFLIIAEALLERGQVDEALAEVDHGLQRDPNEPSLRIARTNILLKQKKFEEALAAADALTGAAPAWQVSLLRAEALVALERWDEARAAATDALKLNPHPGRAHYLAGLVHYQAQDYKSAADAFRQSCESNPAKPH